MTPDRSWIGALTFAPTDRPGPNISVSTARADSEGSEPPRRSGVSWIPRPGADTVLFLQRLLLHYGIYRRYPLKPWPALKNAWRIAFR
jgi:hypothetical protein